MDRVSRSWYELAFERDFLKKTGNSFQDFFCEIMEKCHPGDFQRIRPWGKFGDRKNDGYLSSARMLFQIYAPNEIRQADTLAKINEDFYGALPYWEKYFDSWVFTHNSRQGLSPDVFKRLLELKTEYTYLEFPCWGFEELRIKVFTLSERDIASILGLAPTNQDLLNVGFSELKLVLGAISQQEPLFDQDISSISKEKLTYNALSHSVEELIKLGAVRSNLVKRFFREYNDPEYGDKIARTFREKYIELKKENNSPDIIFLKLQEFAGGTKRGPPKYEAAVLAILSYLFQSCDIFEHPAPRGPL